MIRFGELVPGNNPAWRLKVVLLLAVALLVPSFAPSRVAASPADIARARYWANRGYTFDPGLVTAYAMDRKVEDIERAKYWAERGHTFDARYLTAYSMDRKVEDIERAKHWAERGYTFDARYLTAYSMDRKVEDIGRARYWAERGYTFDARYLTAYSMDRKVEDIERAKYWAERGFAFDARYLTAYSMDRQAQELGRAEQATGTRHLSGAAAMLGSQTAPADIRGQVGRVDSRLVLALQTALALLGYDPGPLDGVSGPRTWAAVRDFQQARELGADGIAGRNTCAELTAMLGGHSGSVPPEPTALPGWKTTTELVSYLEASRGVYAPRVAENGSYYGEISETTGRPKTVHVDGYFRRDGTYVRGHYRSSPRR